MQLEVRFKEQKRLNTEFPPRRSWGVMGMWQASNRVALQKRLVPLQASCQPESWHRDVGRKRKHRARQEWTIGYSPIVACEEAKQQKIAQSGQGEQY